MSLISVSRLVVLGLALFFSLVNVALTAHTISTSETYFLEFYNFQVITIVAGAFSLVALPTILLTGLLRNGSWFNMIVVELPVMGLLWVMWLATAALYAETSVLVYPTGCDPDFNDVSMTFCREFMAVEGLSFIMWIALFGYTTTLLIMCLVGKSRGNHVFRKSVASADFFSYKNSGGGHAMMVAPPVATGNGQYYNQQPVALQQQQQYSYDQKLQQLPVQQPLQQAYPVQPQQQQQQQQAYQPPHGIAQV